MVARMLAAVVLAVVGLAPAAGAELQVLVTDRSGSAVAGAAVRLQGTEADSEPVAEAVSDETGRVAFKPTAGSYRIRVSAAGFVESTSQIIALEATGTRTVSIPVYPGAAIAGRVLGPDGAPLAGAEVCLRLDGRLRLPPEAAEVGVEVDGERCIASDADGSVLSDVLPLAEYRIRVAASGKVDLERKVQLRRGLELQIWRLRGGGLIRGRLVDAEDRPVLEAVVQLRSREMGAERDTTTDEAGGFELPGLAPGYWQLRIEPPRSSTILRDGLEVLDGATVDLGTLRTRPGLAVEGRVVDIHGQGVAGARITALSTGRTLRRLRRSTGDEDGAFVLAGLPEVPVHLLVEPPEGYAPASRQDVEVPARGLEIQLEPTGRICGWVTAVDSSVPRGASVKAGASVADPVLSQFGNLLDAAAERVDAETGEFCIEEVVPAETVEVTATAPGYQPASSTVGVGPGADSPAIELVLERGVSVSGTVVDADDLPVTAASISTSYGAAALSDGRGEFTLDGLYSGANTLQADHPDYAVATRNVVLPLPEGELLELRLDRGGTVEGHVRHYDGRPAEGTPLRARGARDGALTDAEGFYRLENIPAGDADISRGTPDRFDDFETRHLQVIAGETVTADFVLGMVLEGRVVRSGVPVPGATIALAQPNDPQQVTDRSHAVHQTVSDERGEFRLAGVVPGWGTLTVEERRQTSSLPLQVPATEGSRVDIRLPDQLLRGHVVRADDDTPLPGARVVATLPAEAGTPRGASSYSMSIGAEGYGVYYELGFDRRVQSTADAQGGFEMFVEAAPEISIAAFVRGFDNAFVTIDPLDPAPLVLRLTRQVQLVIWVRDGSDQPTPDSRVCVRQVTTGGGSNMSCSMGGSSQLRFTFQEGPVEIRAAATGFATRVLERELKIDPERDTVDVVVHLTSGTPLRIRLLGQAIDPLAEQAGAPPRVVSLVDPAGRELAMLAEQRASDPATGDAVWETWPLESGRWQVIVDTGAGELVSGEVDVALGQQPELVLP